MKCDFVITWISPTLMTDADYDFLKKEKAAKTPEMIHPFRIFDDDGILYLEGFSTENGSFDPLDEFGILYGCTEIHYLENGKFERL